MNDGLDGKDTQNMIIACVLILGIIFILKMCGVL